MRDRGFDDPSDQYLVLFDGGIAGEHPEDVAAIEEICREVGLEVRLEDNELWVRKTQQLHDEIGAKWI